MRVVAFLFGLILLLPGACAFAFMLGGISALPSLGSGEWRDSAIWGMIGIATICWGFCFLISFGGIMIMRGALNPTPEPPQERDPPEPPPPA